LLRRAAPSLLIVVGLACAAALTLGMPDLAAAAAFFRGATPNTLEADAVATLLCWCMLAVLLGPTAVEMVRALRGRRGSHLRKARGTLLLIAGVLVLGVGVMHRVTSSDSMCCGGDPTRIAEAMHLAR
jgi:hypothetical protein